MKDMARIGFLYFKLVMALHRLPVGKRLAVEFRWAMWREKQRG